MSAALRITVRNEHDEVVEYHTGNSVLHIDVPEGRYVITVSLQGADAALLDGPINGALQ